MKDYGPQNKSMTKTEIFRTLTKSGLQRSTRKWLITMSNQIKLKWSGEQCIGLHGDGNDIGKRDPTITGLVDASRELGHKNAGWKDEQPKIIGLQ
jgi:hypothetical protein